MFWYLIYNNFNINDKFSMMCIYYLPSSCKLTGPVVDVSFVSLRINVFLSWSLTWEKWLVKLTAIKLIHKNNNRNKKIEKQNWSILEYILHHFIPFFRQKLQIQITNTKAWNASFIFVLFEFFSSLSQIIYLQNRKTGFNLGLKLSCSNINAYQKPFYNFIRKTNIRQLFNTNLNFPYEKIRYFKMRKKKSCLYINIMYYKNRI